VFRGAILGNADLRSADLSRANLRWANLKDAKLRGTDLTGADLTDAEVVREQLTSAKSSEAIVAPDLDPQWRQGNGSKEDPNVKAAVPDLSIAAESSEGDLELT
jgi:hypothetical protein